LGLDRPLWQQYLTFLQRAARGVLGYSLHNRRPVSTLIGERLPATAALARAKGLVEWIVVGKHALGNALIPLVTLIGLQGGRCCRER
jgi:peptide/nickel transport system permease protein